MRQKLGTCEEKPKAEPIVIGEEQENKRIFVAFAVWLSVTIVVAFLLDQFIDGIPLNFTDRKTVIALWKSQKLRDNKRESKPFPIFVLGTIYLSEQNSYVFLNIQ